MVSGSKRDSLGTSVAFVEGIEGAPVDLEKERCHTSEGLKPLFLPCTQWIKLKDPVSPSSPLPNLMNSVTLFSIFIPLSSLRNTDIIIIRWRVP